MKNQQRLASAIAFAAIAHEHQFRWKGEPYITHPLAVAAALQEYGEPTQIVGVLHDVLEDTEAELHGTSLYLHEARMTLMEEEAVALVAMTRRKDAGEEYPEYVARIIATSTIAQRVKLADIRHNLLTMQSGGETWKKHTRAKIELLKVLTQ
jgi:(p)ppGpp synthase/HD superfamily hydrolase